jgi:type IV pilus assembly protein PilQ
MNFATRSRRAALASLFSFVAFSSPGCIVKNSVVDSVTVPPVNGELSSSLRPSGETDLQAQLSREIVDKDATGFGIAVKGGNGTNVVAIDAGVSDVTFEVHKLSGPDRIVIDMPSQRVFPTDNVPLSDLELLSAIRVGSHPGKSRIVVDLKEGAVVSHEAHLEDGKIVVTLQGASSEPAPIAQGEESSEVLAQMKPEVTEVTEATEIVSESVAEVSLEESAIETQPDAVSSDVEVQSASVESSASLESSEQDLAVGQEQVEEAPEELAQMKPEVVESSTELDTQNTAADVVKVAESVPVEMPEAQPVESNETSVEEFAAAPAAPAASAPVVVQNAQVSEVLFNPDTNQVEIEVKGAPEYSITRTAPSEYVLTLKDTRLLEGSAEAEVVQSPGSGIRSIRTTTQEADTLVRVFAQPTSYLTAHRVGNKVVIQETNDLKRVSDDMRAQIDPEKAAETAVAAPAAPAAPAAEAKEEKANAEVAKKAAAKRAGQADDELSESDVSALLDDSARYSGRLISLDLQDTDIDNALRIIAEVSNLNIVASDEVTGKVTLSLTDVPWDQALDVILKSNGLDKVLEGNVMRIAPVDKLRAERESFKQARQAEEELEPLVVKYLRVSYAKAAELKSLVETVLSERGSVAYDERSNQLIVKDVRKGLKNVIELVKKVDLRTPQVLLETQIVEAKRNLTRELGSELGFQYIQSPSTGNGTGLNFPSAVAIGGSAGPGPITASSFPAVAGASAVSMLFDSADGTKSLELRLSQLEQEGRVRIISRPAVATTNNKPAEIKSVEKIRIKLPSGGLSVATGAGATSSGSGSIAAQTIEAGITLNVTPQASPDYFVLLDIKANSSSFSSERSTEDIPNEIARSASSTVLVSSGQTFALGGIYKIVDSDDLQGVPFFKDIPVLGTFFRRSVTRDSDEELLFFITPRIVEGSFDDASMKSAL